MFSTLCSLLSSHTIQARELFNPSMQINLGFQTLIPETENYSISIDQLEGCGLEQSDIFLIDTVLGITSNLKETSYTFASSETLQVNRFTLLFEDDLLNTDEVSSLVSGICLFPNPATSQISLSYTGAQRLSNATIIDLNGKVLSTINLSNFDQSRLIPITNFAVRVYFLHIQSENSTIVKRLLIN